MRRLHGPLLCLELRVSLFQKLFTSKKMGRFLMLRPIQVILACKRKFACTQDTTRRCSLSRAGKITRAGLLLFTTSIHFGETTIPMVQCFWKGLNSPTTVILLPFFLLIPWKKIYQGFQRNVLKNLQTARDPLKPPGKGAGSFLEALRRRHSWAPCLRFPPSDRKAEKNQKRVSKDRLKKHGWVLI